MTIVCVCVLHNVQITFKNYVCEILGCFNTEESTLHFIMSECYAFN
jgi:hypothetical protein